MYNEAAGNRSKDEKPTLRKLSTTVVTLIQIQIQYSEIPYGSGNPAPKCQGFPTLLYLWNTFSSVCYGQFVKFVHCKKRFAVFPSPSGMSLTKPFLAGNNLIIPVLGEFSKWHPGWGRENRELLFTVFSPCLGIALLDMNIFLFMFFLCGTTYVIAALCYI